jgi:cellobiose phosphorylase
MRYGYFDDANAEYVIERPDTPCSWSNYLGSRQFGGVITNNAGGYAFYRSSAIGRFTRLHFNAIPMDQPGRYFYLRDHDSGEYWSTSWQPVGKPLDQYTSTCRFGTGYAVIESRYTGITSVSTYFVPLDQTFECWRLALTNTGKKPRTLDVFTYAEFASEWHIFQDAFNLQYTMYIARARMADGFMQGSINEHLKLDTANFANRDQSRWWWMTLRGADLVGHDFNREAFLGPYRTYANPLAVERGACSNSEAYGNNACGCLQAQVRLKPGEIRELVVLLGVGKAAAEGAAAVALCGTPAQLDKQLDAVRAYWHQLLTPFKVNTPDADVNHMLNVWSAYNTLMTFCWCRAASLVYSGDNRDGYGFRDTVQDITGVMQLLPEEARKRLELMLTGQESIGGAMPEVKPYAHKPGAMPLTQPELQRSDDCLWFFNAIPEYVNETGDAAFYRKVLPYSDSGEDTVFGHLKRALQFNLTRTGTHGIPCGLHADWDDCIRMGFHGETTFVALQVRYGLLVYEDIAHQLGEAAEAQWAAAERAKLDAILQQHAWDGQWFLRGYKETGEVLGSHTCSEGRIFQPIQSWAVISGAATPAQAKAAMDSVERLLETPYGVMCLMPPIEKADCKELRMVLMNPGEKENAGIFSHSQGWVVMANCILGDGDRAYRVYKANLPARFNDCAEVRRIEPYVYCQTTSSRYSRREGMSHVPWLTGAAAWSYFAATHYILGIRPELDGLRIDPCIPAAWPGFSVTRVFRGKKIAIEVKNTAGKNKGVRSITLNGEVLAGNLVPVGKLKAENTVTCTIG